MVATSNVPTYRNNCQMEKRYRIAADIELLTNDVMASMMSQRAAQAKNPLVQARYKAEIENLERQKLEMQTRLKDLETGETSISLEDIGETLELSKALKDNYLAASPEK